MKKIIIATLAVFAAAFSHADSKEKFFAYRSFWPETAAMRAFGEAGVDVYAVMPSNSFNSLGEPYCKFKPFWVWDETYLWGVVDEQFDLVIRQNPRAKFICMIDINSPLWLARRLNRIHGAGGDSYHDVSNSLCIPEWLDLTSKMTKAYVKHMEERYGDRIYAYMIAGGGTSEWYDSSRGIAIQLKEKAWKKYLKKRGLPEWEVPRFDEIYRPTFDKKYFNPETQAARIHYIRFTNEVVSNGMEHFSKIVRDIVGEKRQVGAFCGFLTNPLGAKTDNRPVYDSANHDFVGDPGQYDNRPIGMGGGMNAPIKSLKLRGKHWFQEIDQRTHTFNYDLSPYIKIRGKDTWGVDNQAETYALLKREFSLATVMQNSLWCFDMWGGVFSTPETMALVKKAHEVWQAHKNDNLPVRAEIVCITDPDSAGYVNHLQVEHFKRMLFSCGAPFDHIFFDDISKVDFAKYKVVVLPHLWELTPEKKKILDKYVFTGGKTVVTAEGVAVTDGKKMDKAFTEKFTGFEYRKPGVNKKDMGGWTSVYAGKGGDYNKENFMEIIKSAGVHTYTDEPLPVYANEKLVAIHTKEGGKKTVYLPRKVSKAKELYTDKVIDVNGDKFEYDFAVPDTALFELVD